VSQIVYVADRTLVAVEKNQLLLPPTTSRGAIPITVQELLWSRETGVGRRGREEGGGGGRKGKEIGIGRKEERGDRVRQREWGGEGGEG